MFPCGTNEGRHGSALRVLSMPAPPARRTTVSSLGIVTVLKPALGYMVCAEIAKECHKAGKSLHDVVVKERALLSEEKWNEMFSLENLIHTKFEQHVTM